RISVSIDGIPHSRIRMRFKIALSVGGDVRSETQPASGCDHSADMRLAEMGRRVGMRVERGSGPSRDRVAQARARGRQAMRTLKRGAPGGASCKRGPIQRRYAPVWTLRSPPPVTFDPDRCDRRSRAVGPKFTRVLDIGVVTVQREMNRREIRGSVVRMFAPHG